MRQLKRPFQGALPHADTMALWKLPVLATKLRPEPTIPPDLGFIGNVQTVSESFSDMPNGFAVGFNTSPSNSTASINTYLSTIFDTPNTRANPVAWNQDWSISFWFRSEDTTNVTQTIYEQTAATVTVVQHGLGVGVYYLRDTGQILVRHESGLNTFRTILSPSGMVSVQQPYHLTLVKSWSQDNPAHTVIDFYRDGVKFGTSTQTFTWGSITANNTSVHSWLGVSARNGLQWPLKGYIGDFNIEQRAMSPQRVRSLYGDSIRNWDERVLLDSGQYECATRVLVQRAGINDTEDMVDFTKEHSRNWLSSVEIAKDVESGFETARVRLHRSVGGINWSPVSGATPVIDFRKRVLIQRAITPKNYTLKGWEWDTRFDGYINTWDVDQNTIDIRCTDRATPLLDQKLLEAKTYYPSPATQIERLAQHIIVDQAPKIPGLEDTIRLGYLGEARVRNQVFTPNAIQVYTATGLSLGIQQRYYDAGSDSVFAVTKGLADSVGFDYRFRHYGPWDDYRLEFFNPPRNRQLRVRQVKTVPEGMRLITFGPHGLIEGQGITVSGISAWNGSGFVRSVDGYESVLVGGHPMSSSSAPTFLQSGNPETTGATAYVEFDHHWTLRQDRIEQVSTLSGDIERIRNHIVIRYNRIPSTATFNATLTTSTVPWRITTTPLQIDLSRVDPDNLGIDIDVRPTSTALTLLNFSAQAETRGRIALLVPPATTASVPSTASVQVATSYVRFQTVTSTATPSLEQYGLQPMAIYEGSVTNIDTRAEAQRLADAILSDLSNPTADWSVTYPPIQVDLHDTLRLESDTHGRWVGAQNTAVVGVTETYEPGKVDVKLKLRNSAPSIGMRLRSLGLGPTQVGLHDNGPRLDPGSLVRPIEVDSRLGGRSVAFNLGRLEEARNAWRTDFTEFHLGLTPNFSPTERSLGAVVRGVSGIVRGDQVGEIGRLQAGTTYYPKFRLRDIEGNYSQSIDAPPIVPRFTQEAEVYTRAVPSALATRIIQSSPDKTNAIYETIPFVNDRVVEGVLSQISNGGNRQELYDRVSGRFTAPVSGDYTFSFALNFRRANEVGGEVIVRVEQTSGASVSSIYEREWLLSAASVFTNSRHEDTLNVHLQAGETLRAAMAWVGDSDLFQIGRVDLLEAPTLIRADDHISLRLVQEDPYTNITEDPLPTSLAQKLAYRWATTVASSVRNGASAASTSGSVTAWIDLVAGATLTTSSVASVFLGGVAISCTSPNFLSSSTLDLFTKNCTIAVFGMMSTQSTFSAGRFAEIRSSLGTTATFPRLSLESGGTRTMVLSFKTPTTSASVWGAGSAVSNGFIGVSRPEPVTFITSYERGQTIRTLCSTSTANLIGSIGAPSVDLNVDRLYLNRNVTTAQSVDAGFFEVMLFAEPLTDDELYTLARYGQDFWGTFVHFD